MTIVFNGKKVALEKLEELKGEVGKLKKKEVTPKLVSILVGNDKGSELYLSLKKKAAEKIGAELEISKFQVSEPVNQLIKLIEELNRDKGVHGVMIQLPLPKNIKHKTKDLIKLIDPKKDVDGMSEDGFYVAPVVKAVRYAMGKAENIMRLTYGDGPCKVGYRPVSDKVVVVGASGFVGRKIVKELEKLKDVKYQVIRVNSKTVNLKLKTKSADVLISTTGSEGLIKADMVKDGVILIDVGSPKGDVEEKAYEKASFVSPVPGGVGPLTVYFLLENLSEASALKVLNNREV